MDVERTLVSKALQAGQIENLVHRGIEAEHFSSHECRAVYETSIEHLRRYGVAPSVQAVKEEHPEFALNLSQDATDYLIDKFVAKVKRRKAMELGEAYSNAIDDPEQVLEIEEIAMEMATTLMDIVPSPKVSRYSDAEKRIEEYERKKKEGDFWGLTMGIPTIDNITMGLRPTEMALIVAWQGVGKSLLMQHWCWNMYMQGKKPLFISLEMGEDELWERWDTMALAVKHHAMRACELPDADVEKWRRIAKAATESRAERDIIVRDDLGSCTPDRVLVETRRYKPDAVFVDYLELMDPSRKIDGGWQEINQIGKDLKRNARTLGIPVVVAAQTNVGDGGSGPTLANIGYKSSGKHANLVFGVHRDEEMLANKKAEIRLLKSRNGPIATTEMDWDPPRMHFKEKTMAEYARERRKKKEA